MRTFHAFGIFFYEFQGIIFASFNETFDKKYPKNVRFFKKITSEFYFRTAITF